MKECFWYSLHTLTSNRLICIGCQTCIPIGAYSLLPNPGLIMQVCYVLIYFNNLLTLIHVNEFKKYKEDENHYKKNMTWEPYHIPEDFLPKTVPNKVLSFKPITRPPTPHPSFSLINENIWECLHPMGYGHCEALLTFT